MSETQSNRAASTPEPSPREVALEQRVAELEAHAADLSSQLGAIHGSKMWRLWMWSIAARRGILRPFTATGRWLRRGLAFLLGALLAGSGYLARGLGELGLWLYLVAGTVGRWVMSGTRRVVRSEVRLIGPDEVPDEASGDGDVRPRVLIVCPYPIYPPNHGGGVRLFNLVRELSADCDLYLLIFIRGDDDPEQRDALSAYCREVHFHHWKPSFDRPLTLEPPNVRLFRSHRAAARIRDIVKTRHIDVLQLEYTELAQYRLADDGVRVILVEHDVAFRSFWRRRQLGFHERFPDSRAFGASFGDWMRLLRHEVEACRRVDQIHVMSHEDGSYLSAFLPDGGERMRVVPNAVDTAFYRPKEPGPADRQGVLFVGNFENLPNVDALEYFVADVWPKVRAEKPDAVLSLVGAKMSDEVRALDGKDGIEVVGAVPDMRPSYHGHRLLVAPIRAGSGTRLKLFEAFASGIPVVSTTLGAEGIDYEAGTHLLIGDDAQTFAAGVLRLLDDDTLHDNLSRNGLKLASERYDWSRSAQVNLAGFRELLADAPRPRIALEAETLEAEIAAPAQEAETRPDVSIVIPTLNGGDLLGRCLDGIAGQVTERSFEVILVDSGSDASSLEVMERHETRIHPIQKKDFNHGLTRDLGASLARGEVLVFLNQDAVPRDEHWLQDLTAPFFGEDPPAAVQGGILEFPHGGEANGVPVRRFFWDSCGERFYFTRESDRWIRHYQGIGFSTVNAAIDRQVWQEIPFGWAPIMEDKKWQREVMERGLRIASDHQAAVYHTHDYDMRSLRRRCESEGLGWRLLGESYDFGDMVRDMMKPGVYRELWRGLVRRKVRKPAELFFPWLRPWMLYLGNRWSRSVKL